MICKTFRIAFCNGTDVPYSTYEFDVIGPKALFEKYQNENEANYDCNGIIECTEDIIHATLDCCVASDEIEGFYTYEIVNPDTMVPCMARWRDFFEEYGFDTSEMVRV